MAVHSSAYPRLVARGARWCLDHTWWTFFAAVATLAISGLSAARVRLDPSPEAYLEGAATWGDYDKINKAYGIGEAIVVALHEPGGTVFDAETVRAAAELDRLIALLPSVKRVLSIASASVLGEVRPGDDVDVIDVGRLLPDGEVTQESATVLGQRIARHKVYRRVLVDTRHETAFLLVQLDPALTDSAGRIDAVRAIRVEADRFRTQYRSVHLGGPPVTKEAIASGVERDAKIFFPAAAALLIALLWIMFGDFLAALIPISVIGFTSIFVIGLLAALGVPLNMATVTVPTIILVIGLADSVHLLAELRRQFARTGDREGSLVATVEAIAFPCLLTAATSAAGFAALTSSRVGPLREFGAAAALGLMVAYGCSMFLTPVLLNVLGYPRDAMRQFVAAPRMARVLTRFAVATGKNVLVPIAVTGLLTGTCFAAMAMIESNSDFVAHLDPGHRLRRDIEIIGQTLGGSDTLEVLIRSDRPGTFLEPEMLRKADEVGNALRKIEQVPGVLSFVDYLKLANSVLDTSTGFAIPGSRAAVSQVLLLEAEGFAALAAPDLHEMRMSIQVPTMSSEAVRELVARIRSTAREVLQGSGLDVEVTGVPVLFAEVARHIIEDTQNSFIAGAVMIWLAMLLGFRSVSLATVAMIPNILPIGLVFVTMAVLGIRFDTNSAFVACLGVGIAVDDTIHIVARYQRAQEQGSPTAVTAVRYALTHAGHPVILTCVLLVVGFSVFGLSSFQPTMRIGLLSAQLVVYATIFDLCFLPALLIALERVLARFEPRPSRVVPVLAVDGLEDEE